MKSPANSLQFSEPMPVAEDKSFQKDVVTQTDNKFESVLLLAIL